MTNVLTLVRLDGVECYHGAVGDDGVGFDIEVHERFDDRATRRAVVFTFKAEGVVGVADVCVVNHDSPAAAEFLWGGDFALGGIYGETFGA